MSRRPEYEKQSMKESIQDTLGGGSDIDSGNPLPTTATISITTTVISTSSSEAISGGETIYFPTAGADIDDYGLKTITVKADYALTGSVEISDDAGVTWDRYYPKTADFTLVAGQLKAMSFEEDFALCRVKLINGDASGHTVNYVVIKGRSN